MRALGLLVCLLLLSACDQMKKTQIVVPLGSKVVFTDPHNMEDIFSMIVNTQLHMGLLKYLPDGQLASGIATSWSVSDDGLTYTFKLGQHQFSDGSKVAPLDVVKSLQRIFIKESSISADLQNIAGVDEFKKNKKPEVLQILAKDADTVVIKLQKPNAILLKQLATPDTAVLKLNDKFDIVDEKISSGPYHLVEKTAESLHLELTKKNEYGSKNPPSKVVFRLNTPPESLELAKNKELDFMSVSSSKALGINELKKRHWFEAVGSMTHENFLVFNSKVVPAEWRTYFFHHFNSKELLNELNYDSKEAAYGLVPSVLKGFISKSVFSEKDLDYDEKKLQEFHLKVVYMKFESVDQVIGYLKKKWNHPKLKITFEVLEIDDFLQGVYKKEFDSFIVSKGLDYPDAMANISYFKSDLKDNFFLVFDKQIDEKIDECSSAVNRESQCFIEAQTMIMQKKSVLPLYFGSGRVEYWSDRVANVPAHPLGIQFLIFDYIEMK